MKALARISVIATLAVLAATFSAGAASADEGAHGPSAGDGGAQASNITWED